MHCFKCVSLATLIAVQKKNSTRHKRDSNTGVFVDSITIGTSALNCYTVVSTCYLVRCYAVATRVIATDADFAHFACE